MCSSAAGTEVPSQGSSSDFDFAPVEPEDPDDNGDDDPVEDDPDDPADPDDPDAPDEPTPDEPIRPEHIVAFFAFDDGGLTADPKSYSSCSSNRNPCP